jgi:hypothetical protein
VPQSGLFLVQLSPVKSALDADDGVNEDLERELEREVEGRIGVGTLGVSVTPTPWLSLERRICLTECPRMSMILCRHCAQRDRVKGVCNSCLIEWAWEAAGASRIQPPQCSSCLNILSAE